MEGKNNGVHRDPVSGASGDVSDLLAEDGFYRALASRQRRRVLGYLLEERECTVDELATVLVGWETGAGDPARKEAYKRVRIGLRHAHLPLLDSVGLVEHDDEAGVVRVAPLDAEVADLIGRSIEAERG